MMNGFAAEDISLQSANNIGKNDSIVNTKIVNGFVSANDTESQSTAMETSTVNKEHKEEKPSVRKHVRKRKLQPNENCEEVVLTGYVKRMAAKNAMACVNAMLESSPKKNNASHLHEDSAVLWKKNLRLQQQQNYSDIVPSGRGKPTRKRKPTSATTESMQHNKKKSKTDLLEELHYETSSSSGSSSSSECDEGQVPHAATETACDYVTPYNAFGLLYNGDCMHSHARFHFQSEVAYENSEDNNIVRRLVPSIVPAQIKNVEACKERILSEELNIKHRPQKGDNGWTPIGNPIKTIIINKGKGIKSERKYYIGIKRKGEKIYTRDSILLKSGSRKGDIPFVSKISSIWQENGGLTMTVLWYYRKQDSDPAITSQFFEMEIMASQHQDDISVACIDDKCIVLGLRDFCRFRAISKQIPLARKSLRSSHSVTKLKQQLLKLSGINDVQKWFQTSEVYLCFRAYNHISTKIIAK